MNPRSIHFRLIAWYSALVTLVALAFAAFTYQRLQSGLTAEMEETLVRRAGQINKNILQVSPMPLPRAVARRIEAVYSPEANSRLIRISRADGSIFYVSGQPKDDLFHPADIPLPRPAPQDVTVRREKLASGFDLLVVTVPKQVNGQTWLIEMGTPSSDIDTALHELLATLLFSLPVIIVIAAAGGFYLVRRSLKPVEAIRATAEQITFGNLSNRLPVAATGDALEHLSVTLNQMLERLEGAYRQASRFSADASHELRTPLAIMRTELESVVQEPLLPSALCERIGSVLEETEYLSRITESLFAISRLDAGEARMESRLFDLAALARSTADQMLLLAEEKQIVVEIEAVQEVMIEGDPVRLKQAIVNLLDNAIKYTPRGGRIIVRVAATGSKAQVEIRDNGIGIALEALPHVFERFYRADKARSREAGGAGLGLSIVRSIVQAHGGSVIIESKEGEGTLCRIELPLASIQESMT